MKFKQRVILSAIVLVLVVSAGIFGYYYVTTRQDYTVINYITKMQVRPNKFIDYGKDINVSSANDLGYILSDGKIILSYGEQIIEIQKDSLKSQEFVDKLAYIGIVVKQHGDQYKITYWGEEIDEWVNIY